MVAGHRMLEKDLPSDRARFGDEDEQKIQRRHSFSSTWPTWRAVIATPAQIRRIPSHRCLWISSPRKINAPSGTSTWINPVRLYAIFRAANRNAYNQLNRLAMWAAIPSQIQPELNPRKPKIAAPPIDSVAPRFIKSCA